MRLINPLGDPLGSALNGGSAPAHEVEAQARRHVMGDPGFLPFYEPWKRLHAMLGSDLKA